MDNQRDVILSATDVRSRRVTLLVRAAILSAFLAILVAFNGLAVEPTSAGGTKEYRFKNGEAQNLGKASDIHILFEDGAKVKFGAQVPAGTFPDTRGAGGNVVDLAVGFTGTEVDTGQSVVLTFDYAGTNPPTVSKWWWTSKNTLFSTEGKTSDHLGGVKKVEKEKCDFDYVSAVGDGEIIVSSGDESFIFTTLAGESGAVSALRLVNEIDSSLTYAIAYLLSATEVFFQGIAFGVPEEDGEIGVTESDSAGTMSCGPVGGTTELLVSGSEAPSENAGSSGDSTLPIGAAAGGLLIALAGGGLYLRRRLVR